jgi:hypothetical protein
MKRGTYCDGVGWTFTVRALNLVAAIALLTLLLLYGPGAVTLGFVIWMLTALAGELAHGASI